jgi:dolichol-phosphate mannosyltransferase
MKVVNIIPTYNEKENIGIMLDALLDIEKKNPRWEFVHLVADDNSPDGTADIVRQYMKKHKNIHLITGPKKGLGHALLRSYKYAVENLGAEVIIPNDADMSFDPYKIPELLAKIEEGYDVVVASRHVGEGGTEGWSLFRKLNHWFSNIFFATYVAGIKEVKDHNGNFKAIRVKGVLDQIDLDKLLEKIKIRGFVIQTYILYELSKHTKKFTEVPVVFRFRTRGEAKIGKKYLKSYLRDVLEYMKLCLLMRLERSAQFFKFCVVGFLGYLVNASTLYLFANVLKFSEPVSWGLSTEVAIISNFTWNNLWTFAKKKFTKPKDIAKKFLQFNFTSAGALLIQTIAGTIGVKIFGSQYRQILLPLIIVFLVLPYNYLMYTRIIWRKKIN